MVQLPGKMIIRAPSASQQDHSCGANLAEGPQHGRRGQAKYAVWAIEPETLTVLLVYTGWKWNYPGLEYCLPLLETANKATVPLLSTAVCDSDGVICMIEDLYPLKLCHNQSIRYLCYILIHDWQADDGKVCFQLISRLLLLYEWMNRWILRPIRA